MVLAILLGEFCRSVLITHIMMLLPSQALSNLSARIGQV